MWKIKFLIKCAAGILPLSYHFWRCFGIFRHGKMDDLEYAQRIFSKHFRFFEGETSRKIVLEIGPGDSIISGLIANSQGFEQTYLVDVSDFVSKDIRFYEPAMKRLFKDQISVASFHELLSKMQISYLTNGLNSLRMIESESIDFIFGNSVIQHIHKSQIEIYLREMFRILKFGSVASFRIDLRDMIDDSLNHLRFSEKFWNSIFMSKMIFHTNRLRSSDWEKICTNVGFSITHSKYDRWEKLPMSRNNFSSEFDKYKTNELLVSGLDLVLKKK